MQSLCKNEMVCYWPCLHLYMSASERVDTWVMAWSGHQAETNSGLAQSYKRGSITCQVQHGPITVRPKPTSFSQSGWAKPGPNRAFVPIVGANNH